MPRKESLYPNDWLKIAEKDLTRVESLIKINDPEAAGYYLQQAVEKFLKAFLLSNGWKLDRIHDLEALLNAALKYDPSLEIYRDACQKITGFYMVERYPLIMDTGLTIMDVRKSIADIKSLIEKLRNAVMDV